MYILDAVVSDVTGTPFKAFIEEQYNKRRAVKQQMKKFEVGSSEYAALDSQQELLKLLMNSLYGKFGEELNRRIDGDITDSEDFLVKLFSKGLLHSVKPINDRYMMYSGIQV
jgi:hypothetical protein